MAKYKCPFAVRDNRVRFILCSEALENVPNLNTSANAAGACCAYQQYCACTGRLENTEGATQCYESRLALKEQKSKSVKTSNKPRKKATTTQTSEKTEEE